MVNRRRTLRSSRGSPRHLGMVSGFLFKLARESAGLTQIQLAEGLGVDVGSVQGWESGRRPLAALRTADLVQLRFRMVRCGAQPALLSNLVDAIHADLIISETVQASGQPRLHGHPLGTLVHRSTLSDLITWPLTGTAPTALRSLVTDQVRRGPVPNHPTLTDDERIRFFDHLLDAAQANPYESTDQALLARRQAIYLLGFDTRATTTKWLHTEQPPALHSGAHTDHGPSWVAVRSSAVALGYSGDREPLRAFLQHALVTDRQEQANLNYWAYWVGEIDSIQVDDSFMNCVCPKSWSGIRLLEHLLELLHPGHGHNELNLHTLWALLIAHPSLLSDYPRLRTLAANTLDHLSDDHDLSPTARREIYEIAYTVRLARR